MGKNAYYGQRLGEECERTFMLPETAQRLLSSSCTGRQSNGFRRSSFRDRALSQRIDCYTDLRHAPQRN